jgi:hypothetical protein
MVAQQTNLYKVKNLFLPDGSEAGLDQQQVLYSVRATEQQAAQAAAADQSLHFELDAYQNSRPTHTFSIDNGVLSFNEIPVGGRRRSSKPSKKRPTARRRRSSKRKSRKVNNRRK